MNLNDPQIWQALAAVICAVGLIIGALMRTQEAVMRGLEKNRNESEAGRAKIYERIEGMQREIRDGFVPRNEHAADLRVVSHAVDELNARHDDLAGCGKTP